VNPEPPPLVSVIIPAYNHEALVGTAIESVLAQETTFDFEIIVGEDCSKDRTRDVALSYAKRHPDRVRVLCHAENLKLAGNTVSMLRASRGRYIAYIDADDKWTDPHKLHRQVTFLEQNSAYSACSHNVRSVNLSGEVVDPSYPGLPTGPKTLADLIAEDFVPAPSIVFRNFLLNRIPDWYYLNVPADWTLWLIVAQDGLFMHFADVMADYTLHPNSIWSSKGRVYQLGVEILMYEHCPGFLPTRYTKLIRTCKGIRHERLSRALIAEGNWNEARKEAIRALRVPSWRANLKDKSRILLEAWTPGLLNFTRAIRGINVKTSKG
jgi:glycosyltransferase involved in cell wall biosynthesis